MREKMSKHRSEYYVVAENKQLEHVNRKDMQVVTNSRIEKLQFMVTIVIHHLCNFFVKYIPSVVLNNH